MKAGGGAEALFQRRQQLFDVADGDYGFDPDLVVLQPVEPTVADTVPIEERLGGTAILSGQHEFEEPQRHLNLPFCERVTTSAARR